MSKNPQKYVLITGCDVPNSYGYELALCLDKQNFGVFAGCSDCNSLGARSLASRGSTRLAILQIDVTKQEEIDDAVDMIRDIVDDEGIWALINCAESYAVAEVEWFSCDDFEKIMQINFLGTVRLTKAVLPLLRKTKGRIVNLSNLSGCLSRCGLSAFSASKFAVEAFSDSLRQEMVKWGVFVSVVEPAFLPGSRDILSDTETSIRLKRVPRELKELYGEEYFVDYIRSVSGSSKSDQEKFSSKSLSASSSSTLSSGYSSLTSLESKSLKQRKKENRRSSKSMRSDKNSFLSSKNSQTLTSTMTPTLKAQGSSNLLSMNRVLHSLVDAVTSSSPKVRYFVGSFRDHVVKTVSPVLPTNFIDSYYMSGDIAKVVPKKLKEKQD